jgi:membrane protease YdiL (CAAX protease family)
MDEHSTPPAEAPKIVRLALLFEGGLAVVALACGWFMTIPPWRRIAWQATDAAWGLAATIPMVLGLLVLRRIRRGPLGRLNAVVDQLLVPMFAGCGWLQLGLVSLVAGVGEELLFRGVLQPTLIGWLGIAAGLGITSLVFGLLHAITPAYALLATAVGAYLGWLMLASGNLLGPMIAHALYDFFALAYLMRTATSRRSDVVSESSINPIPPAV